MSAHGSMTASHPPAPPVQPRPAQISSEVIAGDVLPPGAIRANWFSMFNAFSWAITLGSPMVLYAKSLGASATLLGVIASFMPLLTVLQIPGAHLLPRYGYRGLTLAGWGSRTVCIFFMAMVPLMHFASEATKLWLIVVSLLLFNALRGIASGAWMPWMTELVPSHLRGRFLSREQIFGQLGNLISMCVCALALQDQPGDLQFSMVFLFSALGATVSLWCVQQIPEVTAPEKVRSSGHRVPWMHMLAWPPFLRLLTFNLIYAMVAGGLGVFTVSFLNGQANYAEGTILALSGISILGGLATLSWTGRVVDRIGSQLVLRWCLAIYIIILIGWWAVAGGMVGNAVAVIAVLNLLNGAAAMNFAVANSRLVMATMPVMGRNHFFALFTMASSVGFGLSPIIWGLLLDIVGSRTADMGIISWNRYSIYFAAAALFGVLNLTYTRNLREPNDKAHSA